MGFFYWFRVGMMAVALAGVILIMRQLNQPHRPWRQASLFRFLGGPSTTAGVNLCPTRITRLESSNVAVFQDGLKWYRTTDHKKEMLDSVAVEKWFSRNCTLAGTKTDASADVKQALKVHFVTGEPLVLLKSAGGDYEWMGQPFRSPQMDHALSELVQLPTGE